MYMDYFRGYQKNGKKIIRKSFCAYFDILGFTDKISSSFKAEKYDLEYFDKYLKILEKEIDFINKYKHLGRNNETGVFSIKIFTDNFVIGYPWYDECGESELGNIFTILSHIQSAFIENDIFIRGAIALSDLYMDDTTVIGPALIEAYRLESEFANYPRIILSDEVEKIVMKYTKYYANPPDSPQNEEYLRDKDGRLFLNYLYLNYNWNRDNLRECYAYLCMHKDSIMRNINQNRNNYKLLQKYLWIAEYHNYFVERFKLIDQDIRIEMEELNHGIRNIVEK